MIKTDGFLKYKSVITKMDDSFKSILLLSLLFSLINAYTDILFRGVYIYLIGCYNLDQFSVSCNINHFLSTLSQPSICQPDGLTNCSVMKCSFESNK